MQHIIVLLVMINSNFFLGKPCSFKNICKIYPPTINDTLDNPKYGTFQGLFTLSQEEIEDELLGIERDKSEITRIPTPFEFLLLNCHNDTNFLQNTIEAFEFFTHEHVFILLEQGMIIFGEASSIMDNINSVDELRIITEDNYFDFQNLIRESLGQKLIERPRPNEDIRVTKIKAKARYRDKIKAKKMGKSSFSDILVAICCMNFGINPLNIGELSYVAVNALMDTYQKKEKYELDIKSILAGANPKKIKPKYWIGNN